jgi:hypothetical protein
VAIQRWFIVAMRVQDTAMAFSELSHMAGQRDIDIHSAKDLFNGAIQALLADGAPHERVSRARGYLEELERLKDQISEESIGELRYIIDVLDKRITEGSDHLASEDEQELTERLLSLYLDGSDGMLIW